LSMVFGFVKQSGGHIKIYSEVDHGTSVKLYLPRSSGTQDTAAQTRAGSQMVGGHAGVLVVEDAPLVRKYVMTQTASLGYPTLAAADAVEALKIIDDVAAIDL